LYANAFVAFIGGVYFKSDNTLGGIQNRFGSLLMIMALLGFSGLSAIGSFVHERQLFLRERSNGFYGPLPFFITKVTYDIFPLRVLPALIMGSIAFFMIGFTSSVNNFLKFIAILMFFAAQIGLLCLALAISISDVGTATLVAAIIVLFKMMFAGFLINQGKTGWMEADKRASQILTRYVLFSDNATRSGLDSVPQFV
jgi:ABC-type multidrug transport system permease subunit